MTRSQEALMKTQLDIPFQLGEPKQVHSLTLTPLFPLRDPLCQYVSIDEALERGLEISEVDEAGDVGELEVVNPLDVNVLLYDGEELKGAKQNRILNVSVLIAAGSRTRIPVSCVEQGRWSWRDRRFSSAGHVVSPELRRQKAASLRADALAPRAAQVAVWQTVNEQLALRNVDSPTVANADGFAARSAEIGDIARVVAPEPGQCGVVASLPGGGWCLDAVSRPGVFSRVYPKLIAGYVYDVLDQPGAPAPAEHALDALRQCWLTRRPSVALGEDLRLEGRGLIASGLGVEGELVQLSGYGEPACR
jgi:hypothetical protein